MRRERTKNAAGNFFDVLLKLYATLIPFTMRTVVIYIMGVQMRTRMRQESGMRIDLDHWQQQELI